MNHTIKTTGGAIRIRPYSGDSFVLLEMVDHYGATSAREILAAESAAAVVIAFEQVLGGYEQAPAPAPAPAPSLNKWAGSAAHFANLDSYIQKYNAKSEAKAAAEIDRRHRRGQGSLIAAALCWGLFVIGSAAAVAHMVGGAL